MLGLQEAVAVGMADGYAQASGAVTHVNLHTAPGVGNGVGAIFNAQANKSPLLVTAGQQARALMTLQANLTNRDATRCPHPFVKWSYEPPRAQDVPLRARARDPPREPAADGPAFVSIPMDDWAREVDAGDVAHQIARAASAGARGRTPTQIAALAERLRAARATRCWSPAPTSTRAAPGTRRSRSPSASGCRSGHRRRPAAGGSASPRATRTSAACCRRRSAPSAQTLARPRPRARRRLVGLPLLPEHPRRRCCPRAPSWSRSRATPTRRRARRWATRSSPTSALTLRALLDAVGEPSRPRARRPRASRARGAARTASRSSGGAVHATLAERVPRRRDRRARVAVEHARAAQPAAALAARHLLLRRRRRARLRARGRGRRAARPARAGRSSACSARARRSTRSPAFWTAAAYDVPVTFLVLRNEEYAILKWFADARAGRRARPALDLPGARRRRDGRRLRRRRRARVDGRDELREALATAIGAGGPRLVEVDVAPGHGARLMPTASLLAPDTAPHRAPAGPAGADRAPDALAAGTPEPLRGELDALLGADRVLARAIDLDPLRLRRQPLPAASRRSS